MSLHRRLAALEKKRKAFDQPKTVFVVGGPYMQLVEDPSNPGHLIWPDPPGGFEAHALKQQSRLLRELAAMSDTYERSANENSHASPNETGSDGDLAPLLPGQTKRRRFIEINGVEIDTFARRSELNASRK